MKTKTGALIMAGAALVASVPCALMISNEVAYNRLREQLCTEMRDKDELRGIGRWDESNWQSCYKIVQTVACYGLANGQTGPHPPNGCN